MMLAPKNSYDSSSPLHGHEPRRGDSNSVSAASSTSTSEGNSHCCCRLVRVKHCLWVFNCLLITATLLSAFAGWRYLRQLCVVLPMPLAVVISTTISLITEDHKTLWPLITYSAFCMLLFLCSASIFSYTAIMQPHNVLPFLNLFRGAMDETVTAPYVAYCSALVVFLLLLSLYNYGQMSVAWKCKKYFKGIQRVQRAAEKIEISDRCDKSVWTTLCQVNGLPTADHHHHNHGMRTTKNM